MTASGWSIPVHRFLPSAATALHKDPIMLCPPYGATKAVFALQQPLSIIDLLTAAGFPVWSFDYRGQRETVAPGIGPKDVPLHLATLAQEELTTVVSHALRTERRDRVHLIGFSLGGLVAAIYAAVVQPEIVGGLVAVGTPFRWARVPLWANLLTRSPMFVGGLPTGDADQWIGHLAPLAPRVPQLLRPTWARGRNVDFTPDEAWRSVVGRFPPQLNYAVAAWVRGRDVSVGSQTLLDAVAEMHAASLVVVSDGDRFAPWPNVEPFVTATARNGNGTPVARVHHVPQRSHTSLMIGQRAVSDVFQPIRDFVTSL